MKKLILALMVSGVMSSVVANGQEPTDKRDVNFDVFVNVTVVDKPKIDASITDASADYNANDNSVTIAAEENPVVAPKATSGEEIV
jgi:hypothetical protein